MKKNDIAALVLLVVIALVGSYIGANALIGQPQNNPVQVENMPPIGNNFPAPDSRIFNSKAIDPTVDIKGNSGSTDRPFNNQQ